MKRLILLFLLSFSISNSALAVVADSTGKPLPEVREIFSIVLRKNYSDQILKSLKSDTLQSLSKVGQEVLLRPKGFDRQDPPSIRHYHELLDKLSKDDLTALVELFKKLGDVDPVFPATKKVDYVLVHGSTVQNMRERVMFLADMISTRKLVLDPKVQVVFLEGERPLFKFEDEAILINPAPFELRPGWERPSILPKDERDAAVMVWDQLNLPKALREHPPLFIHAEKRPGTKRAETVDCVLKWAKNYHPTPGVGVMVSNNPYVYYQLLVTKTALAQAGISGINLEGVGPAAFDTKDLSLKEQTIIKLGVMLDNLARVLYVHSAKTISSAP